VAIVASAAYSEELEAPMAIDGNDDTEWRLPNSTLGHVDLVFSRARDIRAVLITNASSSNT
jgi:hypothetical protein